MRRSVGLFGMLALMVLVAMVVAGPVMGGQSLKFKTNLSGDQEVPPVETDTSGQFEIQFNDDRTEARFKLKVRDGTAITQAHLHCAPAGQNGPVIAFLFGNVPGGFDVNGKIADFTLTDVNIIQSADCAPTIGMDITSIEELAQAAEAGDIYANVHSVANPGGVVRGQLGAD